MSHFLHLFGIYLHKKIRGVVKKGVEIHETPVLPDKRLTQFLAHLALDYRPQSDVLFGITRPPGRLGILGGRLDETVIDQFQQVAFGGMSIHRGVLLGVPW